MTNKEIWIRVEEGSEKKEIEKVIFSLIEEDESVAGEIPIIVFARINKGIYRFSHIYDMSESALNILKERFGDHNVILKNAREKEEINEKELLLKELIECPGDSAEFKFKLMQIDRLDRIASALEKIAEDCLTVSVSGYVDTYSCE